MPIGIYDERRDEWRMFEVENHYEARCGNNLHQFAPYRTHCACGKCLRVKQEATKE
jgi:hypothetical protein